MARKSEVGIEYFPMNTDFIYNPKVKLVVAEFGPRAWAVLLPLYCKIYREKGYWVDWFDEDLKLLFAQDECKLEIGLVNEIVAGCIRRSLFDQGVFDLFGVLTSDRIQENYLEAVKRRKGVEMIDEFMIINNNVNIIKENVNIICLNVNIIKKKVDSGTQSKRRVDKKENESKSVAQNAHTKEQKDEFKKFKDWIKLNTPRVDQLKEPFTIDQFLKIKDKLDGQMVKSLLVAMQNYKPLLSKSISAYLTLLNWSKRETSGQELKNENINDKLKKFLNEPN